MKLLPINFVVILLITVQNAYSLDKEIEFKMGGSFSTVYANSDKAFLDNAGVSKAMRSAITGGIGVQIPLKYSPAIIFQTEVMYCGKGFILNADSRSSGLPSETKVINKYIDIPLLLKFNRIKHDVVTPNVYAGGTFGILVGSEEVLVNWNGDESVITEITYYDDHGASITKNVWEFYRQIDFGLTIGSGLKIKKGPGAILIDLRYTMGIVDINDYKDGAEYSPVHAVLGSMRNGVFLLQFGYGLKLKTELL